MELNELRALKEALLADLAQVTAQETALAEDINRRLLMDDAYFERMLRLLKTIKEAKDCRIAVRGDSGGWVSILPLYDEQSEGLAREAQRMVLDRITARAMKTIRSDVPVIIPSEDLLPGV